MSRPTSTFLLRRSRIWAVAVVSCTALLLLWSPVRAGLGNLVKKAKEKATQAASPKPAETEAADEVVFDDVTVELTGERLDHILATYKAAEAAAVGRPELVQKLRVLEEEKAELMDKEGEAIREVQRKRGDIEVCYHDGYQAARDRRTEEYTKKATTDPAILAKYAQVAQQNNASAASDSAKLARVSEAAMEFLNPTKEDSANIRKSCGPVPPKGASERRIEEIDQQTAPINEKIRKIDENVYEAQSKTGGLSRAQWGIAMDRIMAFLSEKNRQGAFDQGSKSGGSSASNKGSRSGSGSSSGSNNGSGSTSIKGFTRIELDALEQRLEDLRKYVWY